MMVTRRLRAAVQLATGQRAKFAVDNSLSKFAVFFVTSGIGLIISVFGYALLFSVAKFPAFFANFCADLAAIIYVFIISWRNIFLHNKELLVRKLTMYVIARFCSILIFSFAISFCFAFALSLRDLWSWLSENMMAIAIKLAMTPISFVVNYTITWLLIERYKAKVTPT